MAELELYDTVDLLEVQRHQEALPQFWLKYFPRVVTSDREEILFDQVTDGTRELAPFVAPNVQGRVMRNRGYTTRAFKPAYVKPKHVVDPTMAIPRMAGEAIGGSSSLQARYDAIVAENLRVERQVIENRWEWMAARAVIDGSVTVTGDDYPTTEVDFGRDPSLTVTLTGTSQWGQSAANIKKDIEDMRRAVHTLSSAPITTLVFGLDAWDLFAADDEIKELLNTTYRGSDTDYNRAIAEGLPFEWRGVISGQGGLGRLELYTYSHQYRDESGNLVDLLDQNAVVGVGPGLQGVRCFGAIRDKRAGLQPLEMFPKMWDSEDPPVTYTMTQSAPLMVPMEPNASFKMIVKSS